MKALVVGSLTQSAGKTSVIIGMARTLAQPFAYLKPFGDRLLYRKKRQWDYDSALLTSVFELEESPELITLGFDHTKLNFMYDKKSTRQKLLDMAELVRREKKIFFIEGGRDLYYGASIYLDPIAVARCLDAQLILVISGNEGEIADQFAFIQDYLAVDMVNFTGVVINKVKDMDEFETAQRAGLEAHGIPILGVLPHQAQLTEYPVSYLAEQLFGRVVAGEAGVSRVVRNVFLATMSAQSAQRNPEFTADGTLVVSNGDRSDMILAALNNHAAGVLLTDDIAPRPNIISRAEELGIPLLLIRYSTAQTARLLAGLEPLITRDDHDKVELLGELVQEHVNLDFLEG